ncbi:MAG: hypothetical protein CMH60_07310 [Myxococcales bacterium]|nr:hypothetical protein [Myxococcales bacterium]|tara:strand:+ start:434 stop:949 length:516 start_codon:yes stop_codon:yes gene_type:complete
MYITAQSFIFALLLANAPAPAPQEVEFRCDNMQVDTKTHLTLCNKNVVMRRGDVLLCCNTLEARSDKDWQWKTFDCIDKVRAQRKNELMWANKASFEYLKNEIYLTGKPYLKRGASLLTGKKIIIDLTKEVAKVIKPRGTINSKNTNLVEMKDGKPSISELPNRCPIPPKT